MAVGAIAKHQLAQTILGAAEGVFLQALQGLQVEVPLELDLLAAGSGLLHHLEQLRQQHMAIAAHPFQHDLQMVIASFTTEAGPLVFNPLGKGARIVVAAAAGERPG